MAATMKGPGIFLAQFAGDEAPFNSLPAITKWAASLGYKGVQIPSWDGRLFDLEKAATSQAYCDEVQGICADAGVVITELSSHLQGQLVAVHPAYEYARVMRTDQIATDLRLYLRSEIDHLRQRLSRAAPIDSLKS